VGGGRTFALQGNETHNTRAGNKPNVAFVNKEY